MKKSLPRKFKITADLMSHLPLTAATPAVAKGNSPSHVYELIQRALYIAEETSGEHDLLIHQPKSVKGQALFAAGIDECKFHKKRTKLRQNCVRVVLMTPGDTTELGYAHYDDYCSDYQDDR
jgi:hypothetical protein